MRCFIAVDIDKKIQAVIRRLQEKLKEETGLGSPDVKWVDAELIHLTLKFLGEVRDKDIGQVCQIVSDIAAEHKSFSVEVEKLGCFGRPARVLWTGISESDELIRLQGDIDKQLSELGFKAENRKYSGHLTLCRIKKTRAAKKIVERIKNYSEISLGSQVVDSICVYESNLTSAGPIYNLINKSLLK